MQQKLTLVLGSKDRSSWSLRPWLFLRHHEVPFEEIVLPLGQPDSRARILEYSPSGKVPCLLHGPLRIWESLAICEYAAETLALPQAWPLDPSARALARSMAAEMHAGFADLRRELPFDALRKPAPTAPGNAAAQDIARVLALWREARSHHGQGGPWLFGRFGIADAMFAPVALRFHAYAVALDGAEREYVYNLLMHPAVQEWLDAAAAGMPQEPMAETPAERTAEFAVDADPPERNATAGRYVDDPAEPQESPLAETYRDLPRPATADTGEASLEALLAPRAGPARPTPAPTPVIETQAAEQIPVDLVKLRSFILPP